MNTQLHCCSGIKRENPSIIYPHKNYISIFFRFRQDREKKLSLKKPLNSKKGKVVIFKSVQNCVVYLFPDDIKIRLVLIAKKRTRSLSSFFYEIFCTCGIHSVFTSEPQLQGNSPFVWHFVPVFSKAIAVHYVEKKSCSFTSFLHCEQSKMH